MTNKKGANPFTNNALKKKKKSPAVESDEKLHSSDLVDEDLSDEIDDVERAEEVTKDSRLQKKLHEAHDQLMRAKAEVENARRRSEQDVARAHKYALEKFVKELLPVIDSLEQALQNAPADDPIREGVELTLKLFLDAVNKFGVVQLDPIKEKFDPQHHEAMSMQSDDGAEANTVLIVIQKGYLLNDRLVRPARVIVAK